ncbi:MAG: heavy metal translocating P-type ATPase metal-binding domain-containing protein [Flavobacteriales bacterium]|nr:heavy metal translocating P-type ATPase metal-binding domain-containing protein [Flavobacteriales bacterium]
MIHVSRFAVRVWNFARYSTPPTLTNCYHCGEECRDEEIRHKEHTFCCAGCRTVFDLLDENGLCDYYGMEDGPGAQMLRNETGDRFAFLDLEDIRGQLVDFSDGDLTKVTFFIPNIHCSSCIWLLEHLERLNEGVMHAQVNFLRKELSVNFNHHRITLRQLVELLTTVGYEPSLSLRDLKRKSDSGRDRDLLIRLAVAGFAFGNIMLLTLPDYLSLGHGVEDAFQKVFNLLNLGLGTLVLVYPAMVFLKSAYKALRHGTVNIDVPLAVGILALYGRSMAEIVTGSGLGYMDSLAGLIFFLLVGRWYQDRTYKALSFDRDFSAYFPMAVTRVTDTGQEAVALNNIRKGDELLILSNGLVPADAVLLSDHASIDYSFVTGESEPIGKRKGDPLFAGGRQVGAAIHIVLTKEVSQSYLTGLWDSEVFRKGRRTLGGMMDRVARRFTIIVLAIATVAAIAWAFIDATRVADVFTAVLIISCPCALALTMPFALGNGIRILGRNGLYLKDSAIIEVLAGITTVIFDKTGTLTSSDRPEVHFEGELSEQEQEWVQAVVKNSSHPLSRAIALSLNDTEIAAVEFRELSGQGVEGVVQGARVRVGSCEWAGTGGRTMVPAGGSQVFIRIDDVVKGHFSIRKKYRTGLREMFDRVKTGYRVEVLSGDNDAERDFLKQHFGVESLYFNQTPFDKLDHVKAVQDRNERVLMVGDGLNDAGALKQADAGFSVVEDVHGFSPACDGILESTSLSAMPRLLSFSRSCVRVVRWSFVLSFLYNAVGIGMAVQGLISPLFAAILMPLSSVSIITFSTLGTRWMAARNGFR